MKPPGPLQRKVPLRAKTSLRSGGSLARSAPLASVTPINRAVRRARPARDTGPRASVRDVVYGRAGGWCEWPGCTRRHSEIQHRLGRKTGGRHGEMRDRLNSPEWLLAVCAEHHRGITSAAGEQRTQALVSGWLLEEWRDGEPVDAAAVPVLTRHWPTPIMLYGDGTWRPAAA